MQIGPAGQTDLTASAGDYRGTTRSGGNVAAIQRTTADTGTLWAATTVGRVFISKNADAAAGSVTYTRLDNLPSATASPGRFISGIYVDPANPNHAWISYSSYSSLTPSTPGHVFSVTYDPIANDATWTSLDGSGATGFPDFPATGIADDSNGDLYVSNDWGVLRLPNGSTDWEVAGTGLPMVEVYGLTIVPGARKLYAANARSERLGAGTCRNLAFAGAVVKAIHPARIFFRYSIVSSHLIIVGWFVLVPFGCTGSEKAAPAGWLEGHLHIDSAKNG